MNTIDKMIEKIEKSIICSENKETKLSDKAFLIEGMSGAKNRIFLNSVMELEHSKYLEIGTWKGSTFYAALFNNTSDYTVAIDNWSLFGGPQKEFFENLSDIKVKYDFYDIDCFSIDKSIFKHKFDIYFYDGEHDQEDQKKALTYYKDCMEDNFIYICDDWNFEKVQKGTRDGLKEGNIKIHKEWVLGNKDSYADSSNWWNSIYVAVCSR